MVSDGFNLANGLRKFEIVADCPQQKKEK